MKLTTKNCIWVTGTGRSGTSLIAWILSELGWDMGVKVRPGGKTGYGEAPHVCRTNSQIIVALREAAPWIDDPDLNLAFRKPGDPKALPVPPYPVPTPDLVKKLSKRFEADLNSHKGKSFKDPRLKATFPIWTAANVLPDHVILCCRNFHETIESEERTGLGMIGRRPERAAQQLGALFQAILDAKVSYTVVQYPEIKDIEYCVSIFGNIFDIPEERLREVLSRCINKT